MKRWSLLVINALSGAAALVLPFLLAQTKRYAEEPETGNLHTLDVSRFAEKVLAGPFTGRQVPVTSPQLSNGPDAHKRSNVPVPTVISFVFEFFTEWHFRRIQQREHPPSLERLYRPRPFSFLGWTLATPADKTDSRRQPSLENVLCLTRPIPLLFLQEFQNEVLSMARCRHRHLVSLEGCCNSPQHCKLKH